MRLPEPETELTALTIENKRFLLGNYLRLLLLFDYSSYSTSHKSISIDTLQLKNLWNSE